METFLRFLQNSDLKRKSKLLYDCWNLVKNVTMSPGTTY